MNYSRKILIGLIALIGIGAISSMAVLSFAINLVAVTITGFWLYHWRKAGSPKSFWPKLGPDAYLWLYWLVVAIGAFSISLIPEGDRFYIASQGKWIFFLYAIATALIHFKIDETTFIKVLTWACVPVAIHGLYQTFTGLDWVRDTPNYALAGSQLFRARGFNHNPMTYGHCLAVIFSGLAPFALFRIFKSKPVLEKFLWVSMLLIGAALLATFTRGAWIAVAAATAVVLLLWNLRHGAKILIAVSIVAAAAVVFNPSLNHRFRTIGDTKDQASKERLWLWESNWHMFKDHPLLGVGAGRNRQEVEKYNIRLRGDGFPVANAHNNVLHLLAGTGFFGFVFWAVAMVWFFVACLKNYWRANDPIEKAFHLGCVGVLVAFQVGGLTQTTFDDKEVMTLVSLWLAFSISLATKRTFASKPA